MKGWSCPNEDKESSWGPGIQGMGTPSKSEIGVFFRDHHQPSPGLSIIVNFPHISREFETHRLSNLKRKLKYWKDISKHHENAFSLLDWDEGRDDIGS